MHIVINGSKCTETSITASNKLATWIASTVNATLVDDKVLATKAWDYEIDIAFLINTNYGFCDFRNEIVALCRKAKQVIWIGNDYVLTMGGTFYWLRKDPKFRRFAQYSNTDKLPNHVYMDFNKLLHWDGEKRDYKHSGMFYYGSYRPDRLNSFKHWLSENQIPLHVSTSARNAENFHSINRKMKVYKGDRDIRKVLPLFQSSIYIEDDATHETLMTPANRFYETIGAKVLMLYDVKTKKTLDSAGYWDDAFAVSDQADVAEKLKKYDTLREKQIEMFKGRDFKAELKNEFLKAL